MNIVDEQLKRHKTFQEARIKNSQVAGCFGPGARQLTATAAIFMQYDFRRDLGTGETTPDMQRCSCSKCSPLFVLYIHAIAQAVLLSWRALWVNQRLQAQ